MLQRVCREDGIDGIRREHSPGSHKKKSQAPRGYMKRIRRQHSPRRHKKKSKASRGHMDGISSGYFPERHKKKSQAPRGLKHGGSKDTFLQNTSRSHNHVTIAPKEIAQTLGRTLQVIPFRDTNLFDAIVVLAKSSHNDCIDFDRRNRCAREVLSL